MKTRYAWLEDIASKYKILVDTSALMQQGSERFFLEILLPLLKKYNNKLILPHVVIKELEKHEKNMKKVLLARNGLRILQIYDKEGILDKRGEATDYTPDHVFQVVLTKFKIYYDLAFITNDRNLARDLCMEYKSLSVETRRSMVIIAVRKNGIPIKLAENGVMLKTYPLVRRLKYNRMLDLGIDPLTKIVSTPINITNIPKEGDKVYTSSGQQCILVRELARGGEGTIYATDNGKLVAKIYHPDKITIDIYKKIEIMVRNKDKISISTSNFSIAWPQEVLFNLRGEFIGYIMPKVKGAEVSSFQANSLSKNSYKYS